MQARLLIIAVSILTLAASAGCRIFVDRGAGLGQVFRDEHLEGPSRRLRHDVWKSNPRWSPLADYTDSPYSDGTTGRCRWVHPKLSRALGAAYKDALISADEQKACLQQQIAVPERARMTNVNDRELQEMFAALTRYDDLRGWNAAILWAQYDPAAAAVAAPVLARLVDRPPSYHPVAREQEDEDEEDTNRARPTEPGASAEKVGQPTLILISSNMQAAAAEAWCAVLATQHDDPEQALAPAGRALSNKRLLPVVREELIRGIARRVQPDRIPGLAAMLSPAASAADRKPAVSVEAQLAAVDACLIHAVHRRRMVPAGEASTGAVGPVSNDNPEQLAELAQDDVAWPSGVWRMRHHDDPRIRRRFGEFLAVTRHPAGLSVLQGQVNDSDSHVRESALTALGLLGSHGAFEELEKQLKRPDELTRVYALRGLSCDRPTRLTPFATDSSARVRAELARNLGRHVSPEAARLVGDLLTDQSLEVQATCIQALQFWPDDQATPLLLQALTRSSLRTRTAALEALEGRRGGGLSFPLRAGPQERALRVAQWTHEWHLPDSSLERIRELTRTGSPQLNRARVAEVNERLALIATSGSQSLQLAGDWAAELTADDVPVLEEVLAGVEPTEHELLIEHVLPRLSPAYAALVQLRSADVGVRRAGAQQLGRLGQESSFSPATTKELSRLMRQEQDGLVWRLVMQGMLPDASDAAAQTALLALNSQWPDVRVLGCQYIGHHGQVEQAPWLLPLLSDSSRVVQTAAIVAAGRCRNPLLLDGHRGGEGQPALPGLRKLLTESDGQVRYAVVVSMSQLGDPPAMDELVRLAFDPGSKMRLEIVQTLGTSGQTRFIGPLIRLAWTESQPHVRQAALDSLVKLVPEGEHPHRLKQARNPVEAVEIWTAWWEDRQRPEESVSDRRKSIPSTGSRPDGTMSLPERL